ncbi:DinB family protein [Streptomyces sp. 4N509B]|uniref:DinB family protein n=1 Tax=Streptomyces sp. 4N509B TaxID=3457413 RepID=UPI003FD5D59A
MTSVPASDPSSLPTTIEQTHPTGGEREVLEAYLDLHRGIVVRKVSGLSDADARRRLVASATTPAGIVKHLTGVERAWFQRELARRPVEEIPRPVGGQADSWEVGEEERVAELVATYERACEESRRVAAGFALDDEVPHPWLGRVSLRWIYAWVFAETARHAGHADILREQLDGATGLLD